MSRYTDWFSPDVRPARKGVYQRKLGGLGVYFAKWNGEFWFFADDTVTGAEMESQISIMHTPWRGLAEKP